MTPGEELLAFNEAIGRAVTQWAHVENGLYLVALAAFGREAWETLGPSFYSIENFRSKLAFTQSAVKEHADYRAYEQEWLGLAAHVTSLSASRNKIVHGQAIYYTEGQIGRRCAIVPHSLPEPKFKSKKRLAPSGSICVRDIDLSARQFSMASSRLMSLYWRLVRQGDPFAERAQQEPQHQSLVQLRRQIEAMLPPRARSSRG